MEEVINSDLANVDQWYEQNGMKRNTNKYQAIVMGKSQVMPQLFIMPAMKTLLFPQLKISIGLVSLLTTK